MYFEVEIEEHTKKYVLYLNFLRSSFSFFSFLLFHFLVIIYYIGRRGWRDLLPKKEKGYIGIGLVVDTYPYGGGMPGW